MGGDGGCLEIEQCFAMATLHFNTFKKDPHICLLKMNFILPMRSFVLVHQHLN